MSAVPWYKWSSISSQAGRGYQQDDDTVSESDDDVDTVEHNREESLHRELDQAIQLERKRKKRLNELLKLEEQTTQNSRMQPAISNSQVSIFQHVQHLQSIILVAG